MRGRGPVDRSHHRRDGQGRGDALARDGDDARRRHHRCRGRLEHAAHRARRRGDGLVQRALVDDCTSTNDTLLVLANGAAGNEPLTRSSRVTSRSARRSMLRAPTSPGRWPPTPKARPSSRPSWCAAHGRRRRRAPRHGLSPGASSCSARSTATTRTGVGVVSELGASGARFDPERADIAYQGVTVCRDGIAAEHDAGRARVPDAAARSHHRVRPPRGAGPGHGDLHRSHPRLHRREHGRSLMAALAAAQDTCAAARSLRVLTHCARSRSQGAS